MKLILHSNFHHYCYTGTMPHSFGYRAATRTLFKKPFKTNGRCPTTTYLRNFKVSIPHVFFLVYI